MQRISCIVPATAKATNYISWWYRYTPSGILVDELVSTGINYPKILVGVEYFVADSNLNMGRKLCYSQ